MSTLSELISAQISGLETYSLPSRERFDTGIKHDAAQNGVGVIVPVGYPDRLPITLSNLRQIIDESLQPGCRHSIHTVVMVNFGIAEQEMANVQLLLQTAKDRDQIRNFIISGTTPHSAARSFNVGVRELANSGELPAYVIKVDDDSRYAPGVLGQSVIEAQERMYDIVAPITMRTDTAYENDFEFGNLCSRTHLPGNFVNAPDYVRRDGSVDLSSLMIGYNTIFSNWPTPITPNENGMVFSRALVEDLLKIDSCVFSEAKGGSEGLRLMVALSQSAYADRIGVLRAPIFDRPFGDPKQPLSWGRSDAQLYQAVKELGLLPEGLTATGISNEGLLYRLYLPGAQPAVIKSVDRLSAIRDVLREPERDGLLWGLPKEVQELVPLMYREADAILEVVESKWKTGRVDAFGSTHPDDISFRYPRGYHWGSVMHFAGVVMYCRENDLPVMVFPT
jgi:hypothetical protein